MLNKATLQSIQAGTDQEIYATTTKVALYIATGGYLAEANQLLSALWNYKLPHSRDTWLPDIAFMVLWHAAGKHPDFIPFQLQRGCRVQPSTPDLDIILSISSKVEKTIFFGRKTAGTNPEKMNKFVLWT
jgi:hypothetical protein